MSSAETPTSDELVKFSISAYRGIDVGLGQADPGVIMAQKLEKQYPGHLIMVQAGKFLHAYDASAHVLNTLKNYGSPEYLVEICMLNYFHKTE